jgi:uncharacterized Zn finger protein (UPF0148 family)
MEKYGVDEKQSDFEKKASKGCPRCGTSADKLVKHGSVIMCPNCGTEPWEGEHK